MNKLKNIIYKWKKLFCWAWIGIGLLLLIIILVKKPMKKNIKMLSLPKEDIKIENVIFPIKQTINIDDNYLSGLWLYLEDDSINNYKYEIKIIDNTGQQYFYQKFNNYASNIIYMELGVIENSKGMDLELIINCDDCDNVKIGLLGEDKKLKLSTENYIKNNIYYWYIIMFIIIGLVLLPLAREENHG